MPENKIRHEAHHILRTRLFLKGIQCVEIVLQISINLIVFWWLEYCIKLLPSEVFEYLVLASAFRWTNVAQFHLKVDKRRSGKCGHLRWGGLWEYAPHIGVISWDKNVPLSSLFYSYSFADHYLKLSHSNRCSTVRKPDSFEPQMELIMNHVVFPR